MISDVKIWPTKPGSKVKANGTFLVNGAFQVKFLLVDTAKGLFVGLPGKYSDKEDPKTNKKVWWADVKCVDEVVREEMQTKVIEAYNATQGEPSGVVPDNSAKVANPEIPW